ncbi:uncharacterized protein LOC127717769 isoform X3 [Mytilus californianus]|uniref:uncharacterized protein LOC127717769 isoform X3 n=1 Tax=Mytilus californianus TaxID=6549 RepID=UPI002245445F|nr:uncharacterized protein LOC127717769 isoform X3 [Mytilus californianus]
MWICDLEAMTEYLGTIFTLLSFLALSACRVPVVTLRTKENCMTYILVHNVLQIEWFADMLLNCTVEVDTIKTLSAYEYLCIQPKTLYFPKCIAKVTVYEKFTSNPPVMTRNCVNNLDPTFCTPGNNPFLIKFEAQQKSGAHVVFRIEGKNGQYSTEDDNDNDDEHSADALVTQIVLAVGSITTFLAIVICIFVSCRHSRYRSCDSVSERSSPRTVQTEMAEGEVTRHGSMPELDSLIGNTNKQTDSLMSQPDQRDTPPPSYWDVLVDDAVVK